MLTPTDLQNSIQALCEWSRKRTRAIPGRRSWSSGSEPSIRAELGHSECRVRLLVEKTGPSTVIQSEVELAELLGPEVCAQPALTRRGESRGTLATYLPYVHHSESPLALVWTVELLADKVWSRPSPRPAHKDWVGEFQARFRMDVPDDVARQPHCLIHGDPTLANIRIQQDRTVLLIDPKPIGRGIPGMVDVDRGKMLQSLMGWESALCSSGPLFQQQWPFWDLDEAALRRMVFWCMVHYLRIAQRERDTPLGVWARETAIALEEYSA